MSQVTHPPANPDIVVVGAGIAGGAMATVLAQGGLSVLLLEKSTRHKDVVRGEWLAPWGVADAELLGLRDRYIAHGAHSPTRHIGYSDVIPAAEAESHAIQLAEFADYLPLCLGHPKTCDLLNELAVGAGVQFLRGVTTLQVEPGTPPTVRYTHDGTLHEIRPRWVIGADGRNGVVAKQIGCTTAHDPEHHLFSGMLVENAHAWPEDEQIIATEGNVNVLAFPQGGGRVRVYLGWPSADRVRLVGRSGPQNFLRAWELNCVPNAAAISTATPASPCIAYPNFDAWVDHPVRPGVVLIGDAAGRNDPIIGQGLSIAHRDVRLVRDVLLGESDWRENMFAGYVAERAERMSRLRVTARLTTLRESEFGEAGRASRAAIAERLATNPDLITPFATGFVGPDVLPAEVYTAAFAEQITGRALWSELADSA